MNPNTNKFEPLNENIGKLFRADGTECPPHWTVFKDGERVEIKGYTFSVAHIGEGYIVFEPVKTSALIINNDARRCDYGVSR